MGGNPDISDDELVAGIRAHLGDSGVIRVRKRAPFRIPKGGTGSYFENVRLELDGSVVPAVLKLGRLTGVPPTNEARFYSRYAAASPFQAPRCYGFGPFSSEAEGWVLMERMAPGKRLVDWTLDDTRDALRNIARLHAKHLGGPPADLPRPFTADLDRWLSFVRRGVQQIQGVFDAYPHLPRFASSRAFSLLLELCDRPVVFRNGFGRSPESLLHGDYHRGNLVAREGHPQVAFDWQHTCAGPPVFDLAVFWSALDLTTRRGPLGLLDRFEVGERCLAWDDVCRTYGEALHELRPEADLDAIFGCADEAVVWEIGRQVMYMGPAMTGTQATRIRFVYQDHRRIGGFLARVLGLDNILTHYHTAFREFEDRAERLLA